MNRSKLSDWIQIAANTGIIAGLILVALSIADPENLNLAEQRVMEALV